MGNTLKSLIVATSMIAAWSHAEWTSNKVDETKRTIQELILSLDASKYGAARGVLGWDEALLADGDISPQDAETIQLHANKLLLIAPEKAKAVLEALHGKATSTIGGEPVQAEVGVPQIPTKPKPQLGSKEAEEQKKQKERTDKLRKEMLSKINKTVNNKSSWRVDWAASGDAVIANKDGGIEIKFKSRKADSAIQEWYALFDMQLPEGIYNFTLDADWALVMWLFDENWKQLNTDGTIPENGKNRMPLNPGNNTITISSTVKRISMGANVTALNPTKIIKNITIKEDAQAALADVK